MIYRKPKYEFQSVFAPFIYDYLEIKDATGQKYTSPGNILRQFDRYCSLNGVEEPNLTEVIVNDWLSTKTGEKNSTHSTRISVLRCFSKYLSASGNIISWNPYPGYTSRVSKYVPYIFCKDEMLQIFASGRLNASILWQISVSFCLSNNFKSLVWLWPQSFRGIKTYYKRC